jgi:uncharacterized protein YyaL (SSP411 family)
MTEPSGATEPEPGNGLGGRIVFVLSLLVATAFLLWRNPDAWISLVVTEAEAAETLDHSPGAAHEALQNPDGSWKYSNSLVGESSPYLLLHAHNPVDWYPWGEQALQRAREEDKPIFLSVGYSTCYWCHVMEREVFSNPEIAELMNRWFINIKVDREERPDLDDIYMTATRLMTGGGGWPNSVFMTPELKPFFAGTYFPPVSKYGRPGFPEVLTGLQQAWSERRQEVEEQAEGLTQAVRQSQEAQGAAGDSSSLSQALVDAAIVQMQERFDELNGGFGGAPKFPPNMDLDLLLAEYERTGDAKLLRLVTHTLEQMARGGIHDHLGGGFHRYATDQRWRIPHFEKMLYNQAALARLYLHAYQLTGLAELHNAARGIFAFTDRVMRLPNGGFYSALDSETEGEEGLSYLWTKQEITEVLGDDAGLFLIVYALAPMPEGDKGVLFMSQSLRDVATELQLEVTDLEAQLLPLRQRLLAVRQTRLRPLLDTKILAAWNGMMIDAYAYAFEVLGDDAYLTTARQAAAFVWQRLRDEDGRLQRSYRDGEVGHDAFQEDYAFLARGLLGLYRATDDPSYLRQAEELVATMERLFWDTQDGGFFMTDRTEKLIAESKHPYDGATASGNSEAANVLVELAEITKREAYGRRGQETLQAFAGAMNRNAGGFARMVFAVHRSLHGPDAKTTAAGTAPRLADILAGLTRHDKNPLHDSGDYVQAEAFVSVDQLLPGRRFEVAARLLVASGWHINANPASYDFLIPTTLKLATDLPLEILSLTYPDGHIFRPAFADDSVLVYTDTAIVRASLQSGGTLDDSSMAVDRSGDRSVDHLSLRLRFQACNDVQCLAASEITLPVQSLSATHSLFSEAH